MRLGLLVGILSGLTCGLNQSVPASGRKLIVIAGQSNAVGQQAAANIGYPHRVGIGAEYPNVRLWQKTAQATAPDPIVWTVDSEDLALQAYDASAPNNTGGAANLMGPELSLGRHVDFYAPNEFDIAKFGVSGSNLPDHWLPAATYPTLGPNLYTQMVAYVNGVLAETGDELAAFVWIQGETDATDATDAAAYEVNLQTLLDAVRDEWPDVPIVLNQLSASCTATHKNTVRAAQAAVAGATTDCTLVDAAPITLTDGFHHNADSYAALGDHLGAAIVAALDLEHDLPWTVDAISLLGFPANATEWTAVLAAAGIASGGPSLLWGCQDASGNLADSIGAFTGTATGAGWSYRQSNVAFERKALVVNHANNTAIISNTDAGLPDPATTSWLRFAVSYVGNPSATRNLWFHGTSSPLGAIAVKVGGWQLTDGANTTSGAGNPTGQAHPWIHQRNKTAGTVIAANEAEVIDGTVGVVTGKRVTLGVAANVNALAAHFYVADFFGAAAELSKAQIKTLLQTLRWPVGWSP